MIVRSNAMLSQIFKAICEKLLDVLYKRGNGISITFLCIHAIFSLLGRARKNPFKKWRYNQSRQTVNNTSNDEKVFRLI